MAGETTDQSEDKHRLLKHRPLHKKTINYCLSHPLFLIFSQISLYPDNSSSPTGFETMTSSRQLPTRRNQGQEARNGAPSKQQSAILKKLRELAAYCSIANALVILDPDGEAIPVGQVCPNRPIVAAFHYPPRECDYDVAEHELTKKYHDTLEELKAVRKRVAETEEQLLKRLWICLTGAAPSWIDKPTEQMTREELHKAIPELQEMSHFVKKELQERYEKEAAQTLPAAEEAGTSSSAMVSDGASSDHGP